MKKIFTLIAAALMAVGASAKEEVEIFTPWEGNGVTLEGKTFTLPGGWKGAGTSMDENDDKTAFDYVYIIYSGAPGSPSFGVVYNEWEKTESWGEAYITVTSPIPDGSGVVGIKLDKETVMKYGSAKEGGTGIGDIYAQHVKQVQIQSGGAAATVTIEGIYFGTTEEYAADGGDVPVRPEPGNSLLIWEGNHVYGSGWSDTDVFDAKYFDVAEVGDIIRCYFTDANNPNPVFKVVADWSDLAGVSRKIFDDRFEGTIDTEDALNYLKKNGLRLQGINFTLTKVELYVPEPPLDYETSGKTLTFDNGGNIWATEFAGYSDDAKLVLVTNMDNAAGRVNWGYLSVSSIGGAVKAGEASVTVDGENTAVFLLKELKEALDAPGFFKDEETGEEIPTESGITWNVWGWDDDMGVTTATRVSATIYEVVGFDGEGYVPAGNTGISNIQVAKTQNGAIFNLAGQQVSKAVKGVYIQNGKKFVVK